MTDAATLDRPLDATALLNDMGRRARAASMVLATLPTARKAAALRAAATALRASEAT
ncbi:MAG: hypothetical protein JWN59_1709, partial [Sphingomonas bacterium]|nr:hypothetical protein [Sphingomonas bacterium]